MKILVVGSGISGLTLAYWLNHSGHDVTLIERVARYRPVGAITTVMGDGLRVAEKMGIVETLKRYSYQQYFQVIRDQHGRMIRAFDLELYHQIQGGILALRRSDWHDTLYQVVKERVPVHFQIAVNSLHETPEKVEVTLSDGTQQEYDLVVGADGIDSSIRTLVFGEGFRYDLKLGLMTFILDNARDLLKTLYLPALAINEWFLPGAYVEVRTLSEDALTGIFVYQSPRDQPLLLEERKAALLTHFSMAPKNVKAIIEAIEDPSLVYADHLAQIVLPSWSKGRVVLTGDAAHALSPIAGLGGNKAMLGAYILAQELTRTSSYSEAFARYEQMMRPSIEQVQRQSRGMGTWVLDGRAPIMLLKRMLFGAFPENLVVRMRATPPQQLAID